MPQNSGLCFLSGGQLRVSWQSLQQGEKLSVAAEYIASHDRRDGNLRVCVLWHSAHVYCFAKHVGLQTWRGHFGPNFKVGAIARLDCSTQSVCFT